MILQVVVVVVIRQITWDVYWLLCGEDHQPKFLMIIETKQTWNNTIQNGGHGNKYYVFHKIGVGIISN